MRAHSPMFRLVSPLGDTRGDAHALVEPLAESLAEMEAVGDTRDDAQALVNTLAETLLEVEIVGETRSDAHALVENC